MEYMSQDISLLATALSKMQGSMGAVTKNKKAGSKAYSYQYADLSAIWDAIREPLRSSELCISQVYNSVGDTIQITTILMHSSGQWMKSFINIPIQGLDIQKVGSAMTYNRRYAISAILGISTEEDDDAESIKDSPKNPQAPAFISAQTVAQMEEAIRSIITPVDKEWRSRCLGIYKVNRFEEIPLEAEKKVEESIKAKIRSLQDANK